MPGRLTVHFAASCANSPTCFLYSGLKSSREGRRGEGEEKRREVEGRSGGGEKEIGSGERGKGDTGGGGGRGRELQCNRSFGLPTTELIITRGNRSSS